MSKPKHSPGPWKDGKDANGKLIQIERPTNEGYTSPDPERVANFHIVNAAPELLAVLEKITRLHHDGYDIQESVFHEIKGLVNKAKGIQL